MGITGKVKLKPTPDAEQAETYVYQRTRPGRGHFKGPDGKDYALRRHGTRTDNPSPEQLQGRARITAGNAAWKTLEPHEKTAYGLRARKLQMSGYNLFIRDFCREHPLSEFA
jgi:hypothetical protein